MNESYSAALLNKIISEFSEENKFKTFNELNVFVQNNPSNYIARYNLGYVSEKINNEKIAIESYLKVIEKDSKHWQSRFNLYLIYIKKNEYSLALKYVNQVLNIKEGYQPALRDKALVLNYLKKPDAALPLIYNSIKKNPLDYIALNTCGLILISLKRSEEAEKVLNEAIKINNKYIPSYNNLGHCYSLLHNNEKALECFNKAIELDPESHEAINNIANNHLENGNSSEALKFYLKANKIKPLDYKILYNVAITYFNLDEEKKAEEYFKKSYSINSDDETLRKNYSMLLLKQQKYKKAWELFEGRLKLKEFNYKNSSADNIKNFLLNKNKILKNSNLLVVKEQGVGDEILYASMYPDLLKKFPNTIIETDQRLISLFNRSFNLNKKENFVKFKQFSNKKNDLKNFDGALYAGSLGGLFRNKISDFPKKNYLIPDNNIKKNIKNDLLKIDNKTKIGISWNSKRKQYGKGKSVDLEDLVPIFKLKNFTFINLQYGDTEDELKKFYSKHKIKIHSLKNIDLFNDFESIAALLTSLDLFISVSNSTAHLAGALGVETWLIKPKNHATFHYWNQPGDKTPWYKSIKIFSNKEKSENCIIDIKQELQKKFIRKN